MSIRPLLRRHHRRRGTKCEGFTLIELLIVVAIIGIIAMILVPNLLDTLQKAKQKRTVADMKLIGSAWFAWVTDQIGTAAAGASTAPFDFSQFESMDWQTLRENLIPTYAQEIPSLDGWQHTFDFGMAGDIGAPLPMALRSPGADGVFAGDEYDQGPFVGTDYKQDIVWAGGFFVRWPGGLDS